MTNSEHSIQSVSTQLLELPMKSKLQWGKNSQISSLEHVLIKVTADNGLWGIAEAPVRPTIYGETVLSIEAIIAEHLAPKLMGISLNDKNAIQEVIYSIKNNNCAKGALDIAIYEVRAETQGKSLFEQYLGSKKSIRVSYILGINDLEPMLEEAKEVHAQGVSVFKIKIGRDWAKDEQIIQALKEEFSGTDVILYADANETLTPENAFERLEHLAKLGIAYIEEPLPVHLIKDRAKLKAAQILPIIADDSCFTLLDLERELAFDTFDILNIKTARTGFTESLIMLEQASKADKGIMVGSQASSGLGTMHSAIIASQKEVTHPCELSFPLKLTEDSLGKNFVYKEGVLHIDDLQKALISHTKSSS